METTRSRPKWHPTPPPPPTPKILNLPRRHRRKHPKPTTGNSPFSAVEHRRSFRGKLENLFDQERAFSRAVVPIVVLNSGGDERERVGEDGGGGVVEEKWRFQAEILRAECKFLRMERELASKKLERNRLQMEKTLRSAVKTLHSGKKKIYQGKSVSAFLEEEIEELAEKLNELQRSSKVKAFRVRKCCNFDKKALLLKRRLEKIGGLSDEKCLKEIREMAEASLSINTSPKLDDQSFGSGHQGNNKLAHVETLRKKMEGLSKGMLLERMEEEYGSMLSSTANSSVASSATNSKRIEFHDSSSSSTLQQLYQESMSYEEKKCSRCCKAIVRRIVEQVRAETEQWSQMQEMLGQVREEMEELQASRDFWEDRALDSDQEVQSLRATVQEWKQKAITSEAKADELQTEMSILRGELEKLTIERHGEATRTNGSPMVSRDAQNEKEKRVLICRLKENHQTNDKGRRQNILTDARRKAQTCNNGLEATKRSPFRDVGNSSLLVRQHSKAIFPLHCPHPSISEQGF